MLDNVISTLLPNPRLDSVSVRRTFYPPAIALSPGQDAGRARERDVEVGWNLRLTPGQRYGHVPVTGLSKYMNPVVFDDYYRTDTWLIEDISFSKLAVARVDETILDKVTIKAIPYIDRTVVKPIPSPSPSPGVPQPTAPAEPEIDRSVTFEAHPDSEYRITVPVRTNSRDFKLRVRSTGNPWALASMQLWGQSNQIDAPVASAADLSEYSDNNTETATASLPVQFVVSIPRTGQPLNAVPNLVESNTPRAHYIQKEIKCFLNDLTVTAESTLDDMLIISTVKPVVSDDLDRVSVSVASGIVVLPNVGGLDYRAKNGFKLSIGQRVVDVEPDTLGTVRPQFNDRFITISQYANVIRNAGILTIEPGETLSKSTLVNAGMVDTGNLYATFIPFGAGSVNAEIQIAGNVVLEELKPVDRFFEVSLSDNEMLQRYVQRTYTYTDLGNITVDVGGIIGGLAVVTPQKPTITTAGIPNLEATRGFVLLPNFGSVNFSSGPSFKLNISLRSINYTDSLVLSYPSLQQLIINANIPLLRVGEVIYASKLRELGFESSGRLYVTVFPFATPVQQDKVNFKLKVGAYDKNNALASLRTATVVPPPSPAILDNIALRNSDTPTFPNWPFGLKPKLQRGRINYGGGGRVLTEGYISVNFATGPSRNNVWSRLPADYQRVVPNTKPVKFNYDNWDITAWSGNAEFTVPVTAIGVTHAKVVLYGMIVFNPINRATVKDILKLPMYQLQSIPGLSSLYNQITSLTSKLGDTSGIKRNVSSMTSVEDAIKYIFSITAPHRAVELPNLNTEDLLNFTYSQLNFRIPDNLVLNPTSGKIVAFTNTVNPIVTVNETANHFFKRDILNTTAINSRNVVHDKTTTIDYNELLIPQVTLVADSAGCIVNFKSSNDNPTAQIPTINTQVETLALEGFNNPKANFYMPGRHGSGFNWFSLELTVPVSVGSLVKIGLGDGGSRRYNAGFEANGSSDYGFLGGQVYLIKDVVEDMSSSPSSPSSLAPISSSVSSTVPSKKVNKRNRRQWPDAWYTELLTGAPGDEWSTESVGVTDGLERYIIPDVTRYLRLSLIDIPKHTQLAVGFELFLRGPWVGSSAAVPQRVGIRTVRGTRRDVIWESTLALVPDSYQTFPKQANTLTKAPAGSGSDGVGVLWLDGHSGVFVAELTFDHTHDDVVIEIYSDNTDPNCSWGVARTYVDPVKLYSVNEAFDAADFPQPLIPARDIPALVLGPNLLGNKFTSDLVFVNQTLPTEIFTDVDGDVRAVRFPVYGDPVDVQRFWYMVESEFESSLARLLDIRSKREGFAKSEHFPTSINPMAFVLGHVFGSNLLIIRTGNYISNISPSVFTALKRGLPLSCGILFHVDIYTASSIPDITAGTVEIFEVINVSSTMVPEYKVPYMQVWASRSEPDVNVYIKDNEFVPKEHLYALDTGSVISKSDTYRDIIMSSVDIPAFRWWDYLGSSFVHISRWPDVDSVSVALWPAGDVKLAVSLYFNNCNIVDVGVPEFGEIIKDGSILRLYCKDTSLLTSPQEFVMKWAKPISIITESTVITGYTE